MLRRLLNAIIILSIGSKLAYAQLDVANVKAQPQLPTWETYDFIKYGDIGASLYTGTINYSVPIYNYKDNDFNYTLSVDYATNGFRVKQPSGVVGLGWSLSSPGKIIRDVKGLPDEVSKFVGGGNSVAAGTLRPYRDISAGSYFNDQLCHNNNTTYPCLVNSDHTEYYDALPDTYSFNFYGYSGKFRRDNPDNGPDSYVLYDLSSNSKSLKITSLDENYSIVFKDGNGYVFEFTADSYVRENIAEGVDAPLTKVIKSWCLNKITAPNGRSIKFRYSAITENNSDNTDNGISYFPTLRYNFSSYKGYQSMSSQSNTSTINVITNKIYNNKFTGVAFPNGENIYIRYVKGVPENRFATPEGDTLTARGNCQRVSEIDVKYDDKTIKKAKFAYSVETCVEQKTVNIKNVLLKYTDQSAPNIDLDSGSGYVTANIYTDSATTVTFGLSMMTSETCKITVGTSQFTYTGHKQTQFTVPLTAGNNQVKIEFASSFTETTAELQMLTASNHEIGTPNILTINF